MSKTVCLGCGGEMPGGKPFDPYGPLFPFNPYEGANLKDSVPGMWGEMPGGKPFAPYGPLFPFNPYEHSVFSLIIATFH